MALHSRIIIQIFDCLLWRHNRMHQEFGRMNLFSTENRKFCIWIFEFKICWQTLRERYVQIMHENISHRCDFTISNQISVARTFFLVYFISATSAAGKHAIKEYAWARYSAITIICGLGTFRWFIIIISNVLPVPWRFLRCSHESHLNLNVGSPATFSSFHYFVFTQRPIVSICR